MSAEPVPHEHRYQLGEHQGVKVTMRLIELRGDEARRRRERQLGAIMRLLRRAAADTAPERASAFPRPETEGAPR